MCYHATIVVLPLVQLDTYRKKKVLKKNHFSFSLISSFGSGQQGASKLEVMVTRAVDEEIGCLHLQNANKIYH